MNIPRSPRPLLKNLLLLAACVALVAGAGAATYKWVDKDGKVHYSDTPVQGAQKVDLKPITEIPGMDMPPPSSDTPTEPKPDSNTVYVNLYILNPKQGDELRGAGLGLTLQAQAVPELGEGDKIEYLLDGKVVPQHMPYIDRGTHSLVARVVGPNGDSKLASDEVTFTVFQNIAKPPQTVAPKPTK